MVRWYTIKDLPSSNADFIHPSKLSVALPTLSNHHLRIYVVEYDEHAGIAPLAYAENLSQYGTRLKRTDYADLAVPSPEQRLQKGDSAILLSHGDILHLGTSLVLQYDAPGPQKVSMAQLCPAQVAERKVAHSTVLLEAE